MKQQPQALLLLDVEDVGMEQIPARQLYLHFMESFSIRIGRTSSQPSYLLCREEYHAGIDMCFRRKDSLWYLGKV